MALVTSDLTKHPKLSNHNFLISKNHQKHNFANHRILCYCCFWYKFDFGLGVTQKTKDFAQQVVVECIEVVFFQRHYLNPNLKKSTNSTNSVVNIRRLLRWWNLVLFFVSEVSIPVVSATKNSEKKTIIVISTSSLVITTIRWSIFGVNWHDSCSRSSNDARRVSLDVWWAGGLVVTSTVLALRRGGGPSNSLPSSIFTRLCLKFTWLTPPTFDRTHVTWA